MNTNLWNKVEQFLYQLHYEDIDRGSHFESQAYKDARQEKERKSRALKVVLEQLQDIDIQSVKEYLHASDQCAYEEIQQAYIQGITDCMAVLCGSGMLKNSQQVNGFLTKLNREK